jgi:uncharacterized membrane protein YfcA
MEILGALLAGAFIGSVLGFVGAGGAMLAVPILIYIFQFTPHHATTASLAVVGLAATSGVVSKARSREILYREAIIIWGIGLITNLGFSSISDRLSDRFITTGFALVLTLAGLTMLRNPLSIIHTRMPLPILIIVSLAIGSITGLFGIGGGFLAIPILVLFFGTPQIVAAGTSLLIIAMNSLTALLGRASTWDQVDWHVPLIMGVSAIVISNLASRKASKSTPAKLKNYFAILLFSLAVFTLVESWFI